MYQPEQHKTDGAGVCVCVCCQKMADKCILLAELWNLTEAFQSSSGSWSSSCLMLCYELLKGM
jgi:hypothetical protein